MGKPVKRPARKPVAKASKDSRQNVYAKPTWENTDFYFGAGYFRLRETWLEVWPSGLDSPVNIPLRTIIKALRAGQVVR